MRKIAFFAVVLLLAAHAPAQIRSDYRQKESENHTAPQR